MDPNSSPGPDGFPGSFYRFSWDIICQDLIDAIQYCWRCIFIPRGMNSSFIFLLPKVAGAKRTEQFRPIGLSNFCFKIITRIITTRIHAVLHKVISYQQVAFIKGRNIQEKNVLASELVNEMNTNRRGGNRAQTGRPTQLISETAKEELLSSINSLSPILFVIVEEVLSRNITIMIQEGLIQTMVNRNGCQPSHLMFVDDKFIFFNGHKRTLDNLTDFLMRYQAASGQTVNRAKSKCFVVELQKTEDM
ncbi:uncharacterized protein LOC113334620 [Papaver somniferum]|uniref:uncharacterized protein LOC113334620 n=1 Tax=Papaver somniferum TaxID=3469 RepID=UPI000E700181|nr:uncharacterized protein LOC113334620 [Papaver somniferum]